MAKLKLSQAVIVFLVGILWFGCQEKVPLEGKLTGNMDHYHKIISKFVGPRNVDVWLPADYYDNPQKKYPVIYMHDGQNLFDPATSFIGVDWGVDEALSELEKENPNLAAIVVGIWNTDLRTREYMPQKAFEMITDEREIEEFIKQFGGPPLSDNYLKFITRELKPFIDATYRTLPDRDNTIIMGSSMGGLISWYAVCEYPEVFSAAGCISTHWPILNKAAILYMEERLPDPKTHRFYFDYGTRTLDAQYEPYQNEVDRVMRRKGYVEGVNWITRKFSGHEHSEKAWRQRIHIPLQFLLNPLADDQNENGTDS
ncbi:MAG: alpha/beta hydrolase-fold protein [Calditrichia bacterium]